VAGPVSGDYLITLRGLADLTAALYGEAGAPSVNWEYLSPAGADVYMGLVRADNRLLAVARGSVVFKDWVHDVTALARAPLAHPQLGKVHTGFYEGTEEAYRIIREHMRPGNELVLCGHSLGAAHADVLAGLALLDGVTPRYLCCWGEPRPGMQTLADMLRPLPGISFQNASRFRADLVTLVPFSFPPDEYVHPRELTRVTAPPGSSIIADIGVFAWHHFTLYRSVTPMTEI
jgi:surfactin synthase thioesterase subunit